MPNRSTKNKETHLLPLPRLAIEIIKSCPVISGSPFVFPSAHDRDNYLTGFTVMKQRLDRLSDVKDWVLNDCRRSMATHMPALGIDETIIERIQNHKLAAGTRVSQVQRVYNRYKYVPQMLIGLEKWAAHLQSQILTIPATNGDNALAPSSSCYTATMPDITPDTASHSTPQHDNGELRHTLSVHDVEAQLIAAGVPRSHRQVIRYCESGLLDAVKIPGPTGEQWYVAPASVPKAIGDLKQWDAQRRSRDTARHVRP